MAVGALCRLGTFLASGAGAFLAQTERFDFNMCGVAEHRSLQVDGHCGQCIASRLCTRGRTAVATAESTSGEHVENVTHVAESAAESAMHAAGVRIVRVHAGVEHLTLLWIGQHFVGVIDFLEFVFEFRTCDIGMIFAAHLSISFFDLVVACGAVYAQHFVIVRHGCSFSLLLFACHCAIRRGQLLFWFSS